MIVFSLINLRWIFRLTRPFFFNFKKEKLLVFKKNMYENVSWLESCDTSLKFFCVNGFLKVFPEGCNNNVKNSFKKKPEDLINKLKFLSLRIKNIFLKYFSKSNLRSFFFFSDFLNSKYLINSPFESER